MVDMLVPEGCVPLWVQNGGRLLRKAAPEDGFSTTPVLLAKSRADYAATVRLLELGCAATLEELGLAATVAEPLPPDVLVDAHQERVHKDVGISRPAKARRARGV